MYVRQMKLLRLFQVNKRDFSSINGIYRHKLRDTSVSLCCNSLRYSFKPIQKICVRNFATVRDIDGEKNYYKILELNKDATSSEIKQSFIELAKKYHPDTYEHQTNDENEINKLKMDKKYNEIQIAYSILNDNHLKSIYDEMRQKTTLQQEQLRQKHENLTVDRRKKLSKQSKVHFKL